jgi:hypothetical protein
MTKKFNRQCTKRVSSQVFIGVRIAASARFGSEGYICRDPTLMKRSIPLRKS